MMHLYCKTSRAILVLGARDDVMRVPDGRNTPPGILFDVKPMTPINEQLIELVHAALRRVGGEATNIVVDQEYLDKVPLAEASQVNGEPEATLYLASCDSSVSLRDWPSVPEMLRGMPKTRGRLPYLRVFQVMSGGLQLQTKAVEASELAKHFPPAESEPEKH